jgi:ubiquinone biosynthesis protein UbiJ
LVERKLARTTNLNAERLAQLVGALDIDWEDDVRSYMGDVRKAAIDSVVALRHEIAHGQPTGVTLVAVTSYYHAIKEVVEYIADLADPAG